ncbi:GspH/FimT family pseudopilin [Microbulbifer bruguierae]|uniref:Type II secretion system protein H n=1 Tax=Microbulbifer bruguierae TaxID=3029061 RepID=A0ABY8NKE9_9GAMM|nr:GspH/FimT family pseudopilin [Microbulbifer bruguierae]WGL18197.1 GspH/FimT family pseudopilin [Microbulbifer bruguierae]
MKVPTESRGFTLVELMVVITVLAIVMAIGIPSFNTLIKNNRLTAAVNDLAGGLSYARAEAVRRGRSVRVDSLSGGLSEGLRVWFDADGDNGFDDDGTEELRLVNFSGSSGVTAAGNVDGTASTSLSLSYSPRGSVSGGGNQFKLTLCDDRAGNYGKELNVLASGVMRTNSNITCAQEAAS